MCICVNGVSLLCLAETLSSSHGCGKNTTCAGARQQCFEELQLTTDLNYFSKYKNHFVKPGSTCVTLQNAM